MEDYLKLIYQNYADANSDANSFQHYWFAFENYLDHHFPHNLSDNSLRKRAHRFEEHLKEILVHEEFWSQLYRMPEAKELAELKPRIFREANQSKAAHDAFASDYSRFINGKKSKEPVARLINLFYIVRCNLHHGGKILPDEWEDIRKRNEHVYALTTPLLSALAEMLITQFVVLGIFSYGTLKEASDKDFSFTMGRHENLRIKGHLYNMGLFPAWRYNTMGWVHGCVLRAPSQFRLKYIRFCDDIEGDQFNRRLVLAYDETGNEQCLVWVYHFSSEPDFKTKIKDGMWTDSSKTDAEDTSITNL
jgi:gamma-glutamylcyclotransferase (GGCT)/AIG2-like uncharacterized protein YtfP